LIDSGVFMRKRTCLIFVFLLSLASIAAAQSVKGIWAGSFEADDVFAAIRVDFDQSKIVLSFAGDARPGTISNLKTGAGEISFTADIKPKANFNGKFDGEGNLAGTFDILRSDGTKSLSGAWKLRKVDSFDFADDAKTVSNAEKVELPKPSGAFPIGRKFYYWTDDARAETITEDAGDKRKLFVQIWYPARKPGKTAAEYYPNLEELRGKDENISLLRQLKTHASQDARLAKSKTKFPVIIFSPGLGMSPFSYTWIIENLVSRGYVVASINHPYDSGDFKFSGETIRYDSEKWDKEVSKDWTSEQRKKFFDERRIGWAQDISFVANQLETLEKSFDDKLDLQNLGMLGHSFGGQAATIACASDARFAACANLDGMAQGNVFLPDASGKILKQPFLFFTKSAEVTNAELKIMNLTREEYRARERKRLAERWKPSFKTRLAELDAGAYYALYPGIKHISFSDALFLEINPNEPLAAEKSTVARNINDYISAFFDKFLMKKNAALLDDKNSVRAPVILEYLKKNKQ
jgi:pimeloyl-ACP methyl ester carboxylesterase